MCVGVRMCVHGCRHEGERAAREGGGERECTNNGSYKSRLCIVKIPFVHLSK